MSDQRNTRRGGFYWENYIPFVTVTTVLQSIAKPALRNWYGKMVYQAMVKDPTLDQETALKKPWESSNEAKTRGTAVHSAVEAFFKSGTRVKDAPKDYQGYIDSFFEWVRDYKPKVIGQEFTVFSKKYGYAGTVDSFLRIEGRQWIVDVKTGKGIYPEAYLQLSAYKQAMEEERKKVDSIGVLLLGKNGKYTFEKGEPRLDIFLAAKRLWEWQNAELCEEMGYKHLNSPIDK